MRVRLIYCIIDIASVHGATGCADICCRLSLLAIYTGKVEAWQGSREGACLGKRQGSEWEGVRVVAVVGSGARARPTCL